MYTREEISKIKQSFWAAFGSYMKPIQSVDGLPVTWLNYKTGVNGISFKMDADRDHAIILISLSHKNPETRQSHYQQFIRLQPMLWDALKEDDWIWKENETDWFGKTTSSISKLLENVNVLKQSDWPEIISFLKPRIMALDEFWSITKPAFEQ
ncbi:DUF4268 domain-containing protein [Pseudoflavitalea rhizosphaerae]|uniref:DUF4268 domain-containing protein n=1 Tax=Pseudoflavitalea rhizosphaerae TaxID=1884793 RepID=UPI000F8C703C|nr:DUF4268 domain-containing protein [Pseudoflavitalea rhizosphaerae]